MQRIFNYIACFTFGYLLCYILKYTEKPPKPIIIENVRDSIVRDSIYIVRDSLVKQVIYVEKEYDKKVDSIVNGNDSTQLSMFTEYIRSYDRAN